MILDAKKKKNQNNQRKLNINYIFDNSIISALNFLSNRGNMEVGMKCHKICNVFSSGSGKKMIHTDTGKCGKMFFSELEPKVYNCSLYYSLGFSVNFAS